MDSVSLSLKRTEVLREMWTGFCLRSREVLAAANPLRFESWLCCGEEKFSGLSVSFIFAGKPETKDYLASKYLRRDADQDYLGKLPGKAILEHAAEEYSGCDAVFLEMNPVRERFFQADMHFRIPVWNCIDYPIYDRKGFWQASERVRKYFQRHDLKLLITRDPVRLQEFYRDLYTPRVQNGSGIRGRTEFELKSDLQEGELVLVRKGLCNIAGMVLNYHSENAVLKAWGIYPSESCRRTVSAVMLSLAFLRAKERNKTALTLDYARAFLEDCPFRFRTFHRNRFFYRHAADSGYVTMKLYRWNHALKNMLQRHPFLSWSPEGRCHAVFFDEADYAAHHKAGGRRWGWEHSDLYLFDWEPQSGSRQNLPEWLSIYPAAQLAI